MVDQQPNLMKRLPANSRRSAKKSLVPIMSVAEMAVDVFGAQRPPIHVEPTQRLRSRLRAASAEDVQRWTQALMAQDSVQMRRWIKKVDVNQSVQEDSGTGVLPLALMVRREWIAGFNLLCRNGADLHRQDPQTGRSLLHEAFAGVPSTLPKASPSLRMIRRVLDSGVSPDQGDRAGETPLMMAAKRGRGDIVRLLLDHGADPAAMNDRHQNVLHRWLSSSAARFEKRAVLRRLLSAGAPLNGDDIEGVTPLMLAVQDLDLTLAECLLDAGADATMLAYSPLWGDESQNKPVLLGQSTLMRLMTSSTARDVREVLKLAQRLIDGGASMEVIQQGETLLDQITSDRLARWKPAMLAPGDSKRFWKSLARWTTAEAWWRCAPKTNRCPLEQLVLTNNDVALDEVFEHFGWGGLEHEGRLLKWVQSMTSSGHVDRRRSIDVLQAHRIRWERAVLNEHALPRRRGVFGRAAVHEARARL